MTSKKNTPAHANVCYVKSRTGPFGQKYATKPKQPKKMKTIKRSAESKNHTGSTKDDALVFQPSQNTSISPHTSQFFLSDVPISISGESPEIIWSYCDVLGTSLSESITSSNIADIAYSLAFQPQKTPKYSLNFVSGGFEELITDLKRATSGTIRLSTASIEDPYVVMCFGGQDGSTAHLSKALYDSSVLLQHHINDCSLVCTGQLCLPSLFPIIFDPEPIPDLVMLHCILFSIQYACAKSWLESGLRVDRMIGYGFGQLTALCVAGSLSLIEALRLISERARLIQRRLSTEKAVMLAIEVADIEHILQRARQRYSGFSADIACYNGPRNFVIAGDEISIQVVEDLSTASPMRFRSRRLDRGYALQSRLLDGLLPELLQTARKLTFKALEIPIEACSNVDDWSTVTAEKVVWHSRRAIHFMDAVRRVEQRANRPVTWLEAGSGSCVIPMIERAVYENHNRHVYIATHLRYDANAQLNLARATCQLWESGVRPQFWPLHCSQSSWYKMINLPRCCPPET